MGAADFDMKRVKRGRPFRSVSLADGMRVDAADAHRGGARCRDCPKHGRSWCRVSARVVNPSSPACKYGKVLITAARRAEKERRRFNEDGKA